MGRGRSAPTSRRPERRPDPFPLAGFLDVMVERGAFGLRRKIRATSSAGGSPSGQTLSSVMNRSAWGDRRPRRRKSETRARAGDVVDHHVEQHIVALGNPLDIGPRPELQVDLAVGQGAKPRSPDDGNGGRMWTPSNRPSSGHRGATRATEVSAQRVGIRENGRTSSQRGRWHRPSGFAHAPRAVFTAPLSARARTSPYPPI